MSAEPVDAVDLAAPALLGALLWDARRVDDVAAWLEPGYFRDPQHRAIYRTDSVRRQVVAAGTTLVQHADEALAADRIASIGERVVRLERGPQAVTHRLADLAARLGTTVTAHGTQRSRRPVSRAAAAVEPPPGRGEAADEQQRARAEAAAAAVRADEQALLGTCLVSTEVRTVTALTLLPEDFTDVDVAATWRAITELQRRGQPVDYVLVAAEIERRGGGAAGERPGLTAAELMALATFHRSSRAPTGWTVLEPVVRAALERVPPTRTRPCSRPRPTPGCPRSRWCGGPTPRSCRAGQRYTVSAPRPGRCTRPRRSRPDRRPA